MTEVTLTVRSAEGTREVRLQGDRLTIGRGDASLVIADEGLSRLHARIHREGDRVWLIDEGSRNGSYVNGRPADAQGTPLADGDEITLGNHTTITVNIRDASQPPPGPQSRPSLLLMLGPVLAAVVVLLGVVVFSSSRPAGGGPDGDGRVVNSVPDRTPDDAPPTPKPSPVVQQSPAPAPTAVPAAPEPPSAGDEDSPAASVTLYRKMTDEQKIAFIKSRAKHVSVLMSGRPYAITPEVAGYIKYWLDAFAGRVGNNGGRKMWSGDMRLVFEEAQRYAPLIINAFEDEHVPPVVGLYLPVIETEYHNVDTENKAHAKGLFQFVPGTARGYGLDPDDRTNVEKMAPAAARHIRDNMLEFGNDSMSVAMAIAGYNRYTQSLLRDLRTVSQIGNSEEKERSFWTLVANRGVLDHYFQNENKNYVPRFFAAAIMGETPWAFGLEMRPLSTYTQRTSTSGGGAPDKPETAPPKSDAP
ncbi:MAG: FHA domain-containing protein [Acidobacteria bacterium]|nr:FHA domain-containing protein [Acidobacteriota bacterium]